MIGLKRRVQIKKTISKGLKRRVQIKMAAAVDCFPELSTMSEAEKIDLIDNSDQKKWMAIGSLSYSKASTYLRDASKKEYLNWTLLGAVKTSNLGVVIKCLNMGVSNIQEAVDEALVVGDEQVVEALFTHGAKSNPDKITNPKIKNLADSFGSFPSSAGSSSFTPSSSTPDVGSMILNSLSSIPPETLQMFGNFLSGKK